MTATREGRGRRRLVLPLVLAGMAALAAVAGLLAWKTGAPDAMRGVEQTRPVEVIGSGLPPLPDGAGPSGDPARGQRLPEIRGTSFDGTPVQITSDGRPKVILFLAHWCPHCQAEVPQLTAWLARGRRPAGVEIYSVSTAVEPSRANYPPSAWLSQEGWPVPVLADDGPRTVARAVGLSAFPFYVFVGADGTVVGRHAGALSVERLAERLASLRGS